MTHFKNLIPGDKFLIKDRPFIKIAYLYSDDFGSCNSVDLITGRMRWFVSTEEVKRVFFSSSNLRLTN